MHEDDEIPILVKILTVSDGVIVGTRENLSGAALEELIISRGWQVVEKLVVQDGAEEVAQKLMTASENFHGMIVTTGGTGFGPRDQTPEGTKMVLDREAPGLAEAMRLVNPLGRLSRGVAGTRGRVLILNTPGSVKGSIECVESVIDVIPHAVRLLVDNTDPHPTSS